MLLQAAQVTTTVSELKGSTIMKMLRSHLDTPVNLTGYYPFFILNKYCKLI